ncbi:MAG: hypothetical protein WC755_05175 [Candidatus Woesearchaeota archaeon]|jgi:hypothetical protein
MVKVSNLKKKAKQIVLGTLFGTLALCQNISAKPHKDFNAHPYNIPPYKDPSIFYHLNCMPYPDADYYIHRNIELGKKFTDIKELKDLSKDSLLLLIDSNQDKKFNEQDALYEKYVLSAIRELAFKSNSNQRDEDGQKFFNYRAEISNPIIASNIIRNLINSGVASRNDANYEHIYEKSVLEIKDALNKNFLDKGYISSGLGFVSMMEIVCDKIGDSKDIKNGFGHMTLFDDYLKQLIKTKKQKEDFSQFLSIYNQVTLDLSEYGVLDTTVDGVLSYSQVEQFKRNKRAIERQKEKNIEIAKQIRRKEKEDNLYSNYTQNGLTVSKRNVEFISNANRILRTFPTTLSGASKNNKYEVDGAKYVLVHIKQKHNFSLTIKQLQENTGLGSLSLISLNQREEEFEKINSCQKSIYDILSSFSGSKLKADYLTEGIIPLNENILSDKPLLEDILMNWDIPYNEKDKKIMARLVQISDVMNLTGFVNGSGFGPIANSFGANTALNKLQQQRDSLLQTRQIGLDIQDLFSYCGMNTKKQSDDYVFKKKYYYYGGGALRLCQEGKIRLTAAEDEDIFTKAHQARIDDTSLVFNSRENHIIRKITSRPNPLSVVVFGAAHEFGGLATCGFNNDSMNTDNIYEWNKNNPDKKISLIEIFPKINIDERTSSEKLESVLDIPLVKKSLQKYNIPCVKLKQFNIFDVADDNYDWYSYRDTSDNDGICLDDNMSVDEMTSTILSAAPVAFLDIYSRKIWNDYYSPNSSNCILSDAKSDSLTFSELISNLRTNNILSKLYNPKIVLKPSKLLDNKRLKITVNENLIPRTEKSSQCQNSDTLVLNQRKNTLLLQDILFGETSKTYNPNSGLPLLYLLRSDPNLMPTLFEIQINENLSRRRMFFAIIDALKEYSSILNQVKMY